MKMSEDPFVQAFVAAAIEAEPELGARMKEDMEHELDEDDENSARGQRMLTALKKRFALIPQPDADRKITKVPGS